MANKWRSSTWGEEISLEYGKSLRGYSDARGGYRVFGANGPIGWTSIPLAQGPGVILGRKGAYRGVEYCPDPFFVIDTAYYVVPKNILDMRWIFYAIKHSKLGEIDDGSPIPSTTRAAAYMIDVDVPPLTEQKAISRFLGTLDDKIELNYRMNKTLEEIARILFRAWFVDFEPVRAKMAGRTPVSCDVATAALFPDRLVDSPLGEIPEGWEVAHLGYLFEVNPPRTLKREQEAPYLEMSAIPTGQARAELPALRSFSSGSRFQNGDTLVARITPCLENGKTAFVDCLEEGETGWGSTEFIVLAARDGLSPYYPYLACRLPEVRQHLIASMSGSSGRQRVPYSAFDYFELAAPPQQISEVFTQMIDPCFKLLKANDLESMTLAELRDTLLPKLLSGELRVPVVEEMVEAAL